MANGVQVLFDSGTRLPWWFKLCRGVTIRIEEVKNRRVKVVKIVGGQACFFIGGTILVERMPGYKGKMGFQLISTDQGLARRALQIRNLAGEVLEQNYYLCESCFRNTGKVVERKQDPEPSFKQGVVIRCTRCDATWQRRI